MSRLEFLSPEGLRLDGRRANELRSMSAKLGVLPQVDGSALFELGNSRILATVYGPREPRQRNQTQHDRVAITARFHTATFSSVGGERRKQIRQDRRLSEWGRYVEQVFETAIVASLFPRSQIEIFIEVLNADGSTKVNLSSYIILGILAAAINATTLALINAGVPLYDFVVATSVGHLSKTALLDVNRLEEGGASSGTPTLTLATYGRDTSAALLVNADSHLAADKLQSMIELARAGLQKLFTLLDESVVRPTIEDLHSLRSTSLLVV